MFNMKNLLKVVMICSGVYLVSAQVSAQTLSNSGIQLGEVTVTGSSKLDKYEKMTPEEFAQHKDEVEALKAALKAAMQEDDASDSEIAGAQRALERLGEIEAQKAHWGGEDDFVPVSEDPVSDFVSPLQPPAEENAVSFGEWGNYETPQWNPQFGTTDDNSGADIVVPYAPGAAPTVTTQVTTNENGNVTTDTGTTNLGATGTIQATGDTPAADTTPSGTSATGDTPTTTGDTPATTEEEKPADDINYSGVYKGHQIIPNLMAIHCKVNAEDIVKDLSLMEKCIRQYVTEMNNSNAAAKEEAMKDYNNLRYAVINDNLAVAITKAASIAGYEEKMNEYAEATGDSDTKFDMEAALSNTQAFSTDVMNSVRELYVEMIKYEAINGLVDIDPEAIVEEEEETAKGKYMAEIESTTEETSIQAKALIADKDALKAKLDEYEKMTPEEYAKHKAEVDALKAELTAQMNAADATDAQIAAAQNALERLGEIEIQKANWGGDDDFVPVEEGDIAATYLGNNQCKVNGVETACADGTYKDQYGKEYICEEGFCTPSSLAGITVTGDKIKGTYTGNNRCEVQGITDTCADGAYTDAEHNKWICKNGTCTKENNQGNDDSGDVSWNPYGTQNFYDFGAAPADDTNTDANGSETTETKDAHAIDVEKAKQLSQDKFKKALEAYRAILNDSNATDDMKAQAQQYIDALTEAAPTVFKDTPCAQAKRDMGLAISCGDWNKMK